MTDTPSTADTHDLDTGRCCKIGRGIQRYNRDRLNERLVEEYTIEDKSLRDLETTINTAFMRGVLSRLTPDTVQQLNENATTNPETLVEILNNQDDPQQHARVTKILEQAGIDVEQLEKDFITYRTVKNHLNDCLDVSTDRKQPTPVTTPDAEDTIEWSQTRHDRIVQRTIERLAKTRDDITTNITADTTTRITCNDCNTTQPVTQFIRTGCDCNP